MKEPYHASSTKLSRLCALVVLLLTGSPCSLTTGPEGGVSSDQFTNEWKSESNDPTDASSLISLAKVFLSPQELWQRVWEQSLVMSLSFSWLLRVLVISSVLQRGMTAMRRQTPGRPAATPHHCDDRMEELAAPVSLPVVLLDSRFMSHSKFWVFVTIKKKQKKKTQSIGGSVREGSCKRLGWKPPELCAVLGVWLWVCWANGKTSSPQSVCASSCSSGMAANKQQHSMVLILLLAPLQLVILWLGNARNWGWIHAQNYTQSDTNTPTQR